LKLHSSEEEYYSKSQKTEGSDDAAPDEDVDKYEHLKLVKGQKEGGFKYDP
jgi:hypothetical protein